MVICLKGLFSRNFASRQNRTLSRSGGDTRHMRYKMTAIVIISNKNYVFNFMFCFLLTDSAMSQLYDGGE